MMVPASIIIATGVTATIKPTTTTLGVSIATIAHTITCATMTITRSGIPDATMMVIIAISAATITIIITTEGIITTRRRAR